MIVLVIMGVYLAAGLGFGLCFVARGVQAVDPAARGAPWSFRLLILPGSAALWPLLLKRWVRGLAPPGPAGPTRGRIERTRSVLAGPGAFWGSVLLAWFLVVVLSRAGVGP